MAIYRKNKEIITCDYLEQNSEENNTTSCLVTKDRLRLKYIFKNTKEYTMYPVSFETYELTGKDFEYRKKVDYLKFKTYFEKDSPTIVIPIGNGCQRDPSKKYPEIHAKNSSEFHLSLSFEYFNKIKNKNISVDAIEIYALGSDLNSNLILAKGIDEITSEKLETHYNTRTGVSYAYYDLDDQCVRFDWKKEGKTINYFYLQDLLAQHREFFFANKKYEYTFLGRYKENSKSEYHVFEKVFDKAENILIELMLFIIMIFQI